MQLDNTVDNRLVNMVTTEDEQQEIIDISKEFYDVLLKKQRLEELLRDRLKPIAIGNLKRIIISHCPYAGTHIYYVV